MEHAPVPVHLVRGRSRDAEVGALVAAAGGRVGLAGVLGELTRRGRRVRRWGAAVAFAWDEEDVRSERWWPQGVTSSADAGPEVAPGEEYAGRRLLLTSAYSRKVGGASHGCRVSVVDVTDPARPRYEHVLLVAARVEEGRPVVRPVAAHAGGIVWRGTHLHVAGTAQGIHTFDLRDVVPAAAVPAADAFGHRWLLPARLTHAARVAPGGERFRYSFLSLTRHGEGAGLLAGEYGRDGATTRFVRYRLDAAGLPAADGTSACLPEWLDDRGVARMQGAVEVDGTLHVTTSNGRYGRGSVWTGRPGALRRHRWALPAGPEDLCHWPSEDRLWTVTEYPGRRVVLALDRSRFC